MKEAAGEANLTVVAIILIAVVVAVATPLINSLMNNATKRSCCTDAGGVWEDSKCYLIKGTTKTELTGYWNDDTHQCQSSSSSNQTSNKQP